MFGGSVLCMGLFVLGIDQVCYNDVVHRQPIYPGAEVIETEYSFLRARPYPAGAIHAGRYRNGAPVDTGHEYRFVETG